jgi:hypothetical protein
MSSAYHPAGRRHVAPPHHFAPGQARPSRQHGPRQCPDHGLTATEAWWPAQSAHGARRRDAGRKGDLVQAHGRLACGAVLREVEVPLVVPACFAGPDCPGERCHARDPGSCPSPWPGAGSPAVPGPQTRYSRPGGGAHPPGRARRGGQGGRPKTHAARARRPGGGNPLLAATRTVPAAPPAPGVPSPEDGPATAMTRPFAVVRYLLVLPGGRIDKAAVLRGARSPCGRGSCRLPIAASGCHGRRGTRSPSP